MPAIITKSIGGVDVKIIAMCGFVLGVNSMFGLISAITFAVIFSIMKGTKGDVIPKESLAIVEVGRLNIPESYVKSVDNITGKYAEADFVVGDFILSEKVSKTMKSVDMQLSNLDGSKVAVSIAIKDFAKGISDKIVLGDVVSCFVVTDKETFLPQELNYVEVITTTTIDGSDKIRPEDSIEQNLATVTLLVSPEQAKLPCHIFSE